MATLTGQLTKVVVEDVLKVLSHHHLGHVPCVHLVGTQMKLVRLSASHVLQERIHFLVTQSVFLAKVILITLAVSLLVFLVTKGRLVRKVVQCVKYQNSKYIEQLVETVQENI